ncbi:D-amino-acid transaminase [Enterovirga sp. CN4-39]|uniref:D-amino-acid transaminase n=1 Tax=Enterovirga sp. CN4-39 TaxID=3400910 RepID=UPI003C10F82F
MSRTVFVDGSFVPFEDAKISVMDRGFLFADGIYEVAAVLNGRLVDNEAHLARLDRSLGEIRIPNPYSAAEWTRLQEELVRRNNLNEGLVYMEVTRGVAERDFGFPVSGTRPTVVMFTQAKTIRHAPQAEIGIAVVTVPDLRWKRRDIKSVGLLGQVLAKQAAIEAGAGDAWMIEDGYVTEGSSSTAFIITADKRIVTRPLSNSILPGITRVAVMKLAREAGLTVEERLFTIEEAHAAAEAFITSASSIVMPVVQIDGKPLGSGKPGPLALRLRALYFELAELPAAAA